MTLTFYVNASNLVALPAFHFRTRLGHSPVFSCRVFVVHRVDLMWHRWCIGGSVRFLAEQKAEVDVVDIMKRHKDNAGVMEAAYAVVLCLLLQGWQW